MISSLQDRLYEIAKTVLPTGFRDWLVRKRREYKLYSSIDFGDFDRVTPISRVFGLDRGQPIGRYYIEQFLAAHSDLIQGRALEMGDAGYINMFGGDKVTQIDIMHVVEGNPEATIVADLTNAEHLAPDQFNCIIFTQSLQMIYDLKAALRTLHRILKPGGTLLMTSAGISKIGRRLGKDDWGEYWHLTTQSVEALFQETFPGSRCQVSSYGNVLAAMCSLHGMAAEELPKEKLDICDPDFGVLVTAVVTKI